MKRNSRRFLTFTGLLSIIALCVGLWPHSSRAARAYMTLADNNLSFSNGSLIRTGFTTGTVANGGGGIQLVPRQVTEAWKPLTTKLPIKLRGHSTITYGDRIFVVGGDTFAPGSTELVKSNSVFTSKLADIRTGALSAWVSLPPLPAALSDVATVVVEINGRAFLYVIGGMKGRTSLTDGLALDTVTTFQVYYYPIKDADGNFNANANWATVSTPEQLLPHLPNDAENGTAGGASGLSAVTKMINGEPNIFLFGGHNRHMASGTSTYYSEVYRTRVSLTGNTPILDEWTLVEGKDITYPGAGQAIKLAGAATISYYDTTVSKTGVYLIGGFNSRTQQDLNVYVATIDASGAITWLPKGNMTDTRTGHAAVQSNSRITVSGGTSNGGSPDGGTPTASLAQGYIEDNLSLELDTSTDPPSSFNLVEGALKDPVTQAEMPRMRHGMASINGGGYGDWGYMIGGKTSAEATDDVLYGNLAAPVVLSDKFVANGKYYSKVYDFGDNSAKYFSLKWKSLLTTSKGHQIQMYYRVGETPQGLSGLIQASTTTQNTQNGENETIFPLTNGQPPTYRYFQFVAVLGSTDSTSTPILDWVKLDVERTGFPNMNVPSGGANFTPNPITSSSVIQPNVTISNSGPLGSTILAADWDAPGTFFVDMYVSFASAPGQTLPPPPAPPTLGQVGMAYTEVNKANMSANASHSILPSSWRPPTCAAPPCPAVNWRNVFATPGTYYVYVMVDSTDVASTFGNVVEGDTATAAWENDNVFGPFTVVTSTPNSRVFIPFVLKNATSSIAPQLQAPATLPKRLHTLDSSH